MLNYTPGTQVRPVSSTLPGALGGISKTAPRTAQQQAMNTPAYLRNNTSEEQWGELNRANQDRYRASLATGQSALGRNMQQANIRNMLDTLSQATGEANNYYDTMTSAINGANQNQVNWYTGLSNLRNNQMQSLFPLLGNMLGRY